MENAVTFEKLIGEITSRPGITTIWSTPGFGKTSLLLQLTEKAVKSSGKTGCIFSLEMTREHILCKGKRIGLDFDNIVIYDEVPISADKIREAVREMNGNCIIAIDYLGLLNDSLQSELKRMAMELSVHILVTGQFARSIEDHPLGRATLDDLQFKSATRGSHIMLKDSDIIIFLWRPHKCERGIGTARLYDMENRTELTIAKNRLGDIGTIYTEWNDKKLGFEL